ncbi:MAG: hypothetical protein Q7K57_39510 [Burkholderiaceae bacterium]|nr:hypothetical protein [Burkholderiaceae bacterium]
MPHITIEVSRTLSTAAPLTPVLRRIHHAFAAGGYTPIENMKSRVHVFDEGLAGDDAADPHHESQFVVGWLTTNNVRTREAELSMLQIVQSELELWAESAKDSLKSTAWLQVCVMFRYVPLENYRKCQWNSPTS